MTPHTHHSTCAGLASCGRTFALDAECLTADWTRVTCGQCLRRLRSLRRHGAVALVLALCVAPAAWAGRGKPPPTPPDLVLLRECPRPSDVYVLELDGAVVWTGTFTGQRCEVIPRVGDGLLRARCGASEWVPAERRSFDPQTEC